MKKTFNNKTKLNLLKMFLIILILLFNASDSEVNIYDENIAVSIIDSLENSDTIDIPIKNDSRSDFEIHFLDVGQADAALVICNNKAMLVDGGNIEDSSFLYTYLKNQEIKHLDYVIATHAHEDHIGGILGALNFATFDKVLAPTNNYDSKPFNNLLKQLNKNNKKITIPKANDSFSLGDATVTILSSNSYSETNNSSIVFKIVYKNTSFLFMSDAEKELEELLLSKDFDLAATLLKVAHHGSETSTTYNFLREVMPSYAIISVGKNNPYNHPSANTLSKLRDADVKVFRTDLNGTIVCKSDGSKLTFQTLK